MDSNEHLRRVPADAPASEDLLVGARRLRRAFLETALLTAQPGAVIIPANAADAPSLLINGGVAYRSAALLGQRSITEIILPNEMVGIDHSAMSRCGQEIVAASALSYRQLTGAQMRELLCDPRIALRSLALAGEARQRAASHLAAVTRLDARGRIAWMIFDIFERLRRKGIIAELSFNLALTQDQIADYLGLTVIHVNRTLRRMREEGLAIINRHVVILDLDGLRRMAMGLDAAVTTEAP